MKSFVHNPTSEDRFAFSFKWIQGWQGGLPNLGTKVFWEERFDGKRICLSWIFPSFSTQKSEIYSADVITAVWKHISQAHASHASSELDFCFFLVVQWGPKSTQIIENRSRFHYAREIALDDAYLDQFFQSKSSLYTLIMQYFSNSSKLCLIASHRYVHSHIDTSKCWSHLSETRKWPENSQKKNEIKIQVGQVVVDVATDSVCSAYWVLVSDTNMIKDWREKRDTLSEATVTLRTVVTFVTWNRVSSLESVL